MTPRTITRWWKDGLPRNPDGTYNLPNTINWSIDQVRRETPLEGETSESTKWLAEFRKERAKSEKLRRQMLEGSVIEKSLVIDVFRSRISLVKNGLMLLPRAMAPDLLSAETEAEIKEKLEARVRHLLGLFSRPLPDDFMEEIEGNRD